MINERDSKYLAYLRTISIIVIVVGHVGGFWFFPPYSEFLHVFVAVFFFISGAVSIESLKKLNPIQYWARRLPALLTPYLLLCLIVLCYSNPFNVSMSDFKLKQFLDWILINPPLDAQLPIGQVWFLHTLAVIVIAAPFLYWISEKSPWLIFIYIVLVLALSALQMIKKYSSFFYLADHNLFQPLIHSVFFVLGFLFVKNTKKIRASWLLISIGFCIVQIYLLVAIYGVKIGYSFHTYAPDYYYVLGCIVTICLSWLLKEFIVAQVSKWKFVDKIFSFIFRHTFSIFLLHSIAIHITESVFGLTDPSIGILIYTASKLTAVIFLTLIFSIPFTYVCNLVGNSTKARLYKPY